MNPPSVKTALIARAAAHEPFLAAGARSLGTARPDTPFGRANPVHILEAEGLPFALISRHGEKGYDLAAPWVNDRANLYALKDLGVERIVSWSSPGSLDESVAAGDLVLPDDILDESHGPVTSFFEGMGIGVIRMDAPFCPSLRRSFASALEAMGIPFHGGGVYAAVRGPRLETRAEVKKLRLLGGTVVGMTLAPEVFLARELEMCYAAVCLVVNGAEGLRERPYAANTLFEGLALRAELERVAEVERSFPAVALALLEKAHRAAEEDPPRCHCRAALERYRTRGDIGADWKRWWDR